MILFTTIDNIILESPIHFPHGLKIEKFKDSLLFNMKNDLQTGLGGMYLLEAEKKNRVFVYKEYDITPNTDDLSNDLNYIVTFFSFFWYTKYNTFQLGDAWYINNLNKTLKPLAFGHRVIPLPSWKGKATFLSNQDFDNSLELMDFFFALKFPAKFNLSSGETDYPKLNRLQRAAELIEFSKLAHSTYHKIGLLCSSLECLFTTDNIEVVHKVAERVAFFLSEKANERIELYKQVKSAYSHRSDFLHGSKLKNVTDDVFLNIDNIVRRAFIKIIKERAELFTGKEAELNIFFTDLTFGNLIN